MPTTTNLTNIRVLKPETPPHQIFRIIDREVLEMREIIGRDRYHQVVVCGVEAIAVFFFN